MVDSLREQTWKFIYATFPERQIYVRSDGRVQFFTFNPLAQAILAGISLMFLSWVAFTSVNTIFKDRIIATKEQNFQQMQSSYERRIADLQLSYDELNGAVVATEDRFRSIVDDLEDKHLMLAGLIRGKENLRAELGLEADPEAVNLEADFAFENEFDNVDVAAVDENAADDGPDFTFPDRASALAPASSLQGMTRPAVPELDFAPPQQVQPAAPNSLSPETFLGSAVKRIGNLFVPRSSLRPVDHPSLRQIAELEPRLRQIYPAQRILMQAVREEMDDEAGRFVEAIRTTGLKPETLIARVNEARGGLGGPELEIPQSQGLAVDADFSILALEAQASYGDLTNAVTALHAVPLTGPVLTDNFWLTSGFGARRDPFTNRLAFHAGLDFSGAHGSAVRVTAPGEVVFAGSKGAYGNTVEVDHGYGLKTRYGHLARISVAVGTTVENGAVIGMLGSTGRSTGPHVHYEVWFDDVVRNPSRFLRAGRYVLEEQGS